MLTNLEIKPFCDAWDELNNAAEQVLTCQPRYMTKSSARLEASYVVMANAIIALSYSLDLVKPDIMSFYKAWDEMSNAVKRLLVSQPDKMSQAATNLDTAKRAMSDAVSVLIRASVVRHQKNLNPSPG